MAKESKTRSCPALAREISRAECATGRHTSISCPSSCPHNHFSRESYPALQEMESALDAHLISWLVKRKSNDSKFAAALRGRDDSAAKGPVVAFLHWALFFERDSAGLLAVDHYEADPEVDLTNDRRILLRARKRMTVRVLEIQRVVDEIECEAVDLLEPLSPVLRVVDRGMASAACRFSRYLCLTYPLPHFERVASFAIRLPDLGVPVTEALSTLVAHLGGPSQRAEFADWIPANMDKLMEALEATFEARRRRQIELGDFVSCRVDYKLSLTLPQLRKVFAAAPTLIEGDPDADNEEVDFARVWDWFEEEDPDRFGHMLLGSVWWARGSIRLKAFGRARMATLRARFEALLGSKIRFERDYSENIASKVTGPRASFDSKLVPPSLLENVGPLEVATWRAELPDSSGDARHHFAQLDRQSFASQSLPALGGKTPREAAKDPALRGKLIELVKERVNQQDEENLKAGTNEDINGLVRELGLSEIDFPPPPVRRVPPPISSGKPTQSRGDPKRGGPRVIPAPVPRLSAAQARRRLDAALDRFNTAADAMKALEESGSSVLEDLDQWAGDLLDESVFSLLVPFLLRGWFALMPAGAEAPWLSPQRLRAEVDRQFGRASSWLRGGPDRVIENMVTGCRQPELLSILVSDLFEASVTKSKRLGLSDQASVPAAVLVLVILEELDRAMAGP